jgi:hypothetical protein
VAQDAHEARQRRQRGDRCGDGGGRMPRAQLVVRGRLTQRALTTTVRSSPFRSQPLQQPQGTPAAFDRSTDAGGRSGGVLGWSESLHGPSRTGTRGDTEPNAVRLGASLSLGSDGVGGGWGTLRRRAGACRTPCATPRVGNGASDGTARRRAGIISRADIRFPRARPHTGIETVPHRVVRFAPIPRVVHSRSCRVSPSCHLT